MFPASSSSMDCDKVERLRDRLLMCPICMDEYKDPRLLPCHHTVCLDCIDNYLHASSVTGRMFRCPQCRRDIHVPHGGTRDFPLNFYIVSLQDELGSQSYNNTCDMCKRGWLISQFRCVDCDMVICKFCIHEHRLFQHEASRQYNVMRIEISPSDAQMSSSKPCPRHAEEVLQLYCCTCDKPVCITCMCEDHKRHETIPMATKLCTARIFLQEELDRLASDKHDVLKTLSQVDEATCDVSCCADRVRKDVRERGNELHAKIDDLVQDLVREVGESEAMTLYDLSTYSKDLRQYSSEADRGLKFLEDLQEGDMCLELVDCYDRYQQSLAEQKAKSVNKHIQLKQVSFTAGWDSEFMNYFVGSVGRVQCQTVHQRFLTRPRLFEGFSWRQMLSVLLVPRNVAKLVVILFMLLMFGCLIHAFVTEPVCTQEIGIGLALYSYLFLASYFAYRKS